MTSAAAQQTLSCLARIDSVFSELPESERKAADYIRRSAAEVVHLSITDLAQAAGTSESSIVRFCRTLGCRGYQDLKIRLAQETVKPSYQILEAIEPSDGPTAIKNKVFEAGIEALRATLSVLDDGQFVEAVRILADARRVEFYGTGGSGAVALDAQHKFLKIGIKAFASVDSNLQAMSASLLGPGDAAVGISHSGGNKDVLEALRLAKQAGASIIAITNRGRSPLGRMAGLVLGTASRETTFKTDAVASRIAELAILDALCAAVAFSRYEECFENLGRTRRATAARKL